ncbi:MAG: TonB-dependent receptor [Bacteroidales bacterium]|nr:TonB-dependent receptor [Bacteroidales bacterium]
MRKAMHKQQRLLTVLVALLCLCVTTALAQTGGIVKGVVVDATGESVIGASVVLKSDKTHGTITDLDGNFSLRLPSRESTLVISYVGMITQEVKAVVGQTLRVVLEEDNAQLEEVIVVGYGQQKKASVVGAITQTTGKTLERAAGITNIGQALTGNLPGVITNQSDGMPGEEEPQIVIRGSSTWNNSAPLILVDGVERPMSSVDMGSVESISVLKDASATAVFGVKGGNGVILITTKRGLEGRPQINVSANAIMKVPSKLPGKYDSYDALMARNVAAEHELNVNPDSWADIHSMDFISNYRNQTTVEQRERYPNVDWQKAMFKDYCMSYNAAVNVSGGTKDVKYYAAVDFVNEGDLYKTYDSGRGYKAGFGYNRLNVRSNLDFKLTKTTTFKVGLSGSYGVSEAPFSYAQYADAGDSWQLQQRWAGAYNIAPDVFLPQYADGSWGFYPLVSNVSNSIEAVTLGGTNKATTTRIYTDFVLEQDLSFITKGLSFRGLISWDNSFRETNRGINDLYKSSSRNKWVDPETGMVQYKNNYDAANHYDEVTTVTWTYNSGSVSDWSTYRNLYYQLQLNWARKFGRHDLTAMGVFTRNEGATGPAIPSYREDWVFRVTYNFADRYFAEYNGAYNGSEQFGPDNRFGFFNSGALGWMITNEPWMKRVADIKLFDKQFLDMLKFRVSYGEIGDDHSRQRFLYLTQWQYLSGNAARMDNSDGKSNYKFYRESQVGNLDIHWEVVRKLNVGLDYSFLGGTFAGALEFFQDKRSDIIIYGGDRSMPAYFGQDAPATNLGKVTTKGYELELRVNHSFEGGHRLWGQFSLTHAANKVDYREDAELLPSYRKQAGYAIGQQRAVLNGDYLNTQDELYGSPKHDSADGQKLVGDYQIVDFNGDGQISNDDTVPYAFTSIPQNTYNATIGYEWKGFSCFVQFYGVSNVTRDVNLTSFGSKLNTVYDQGTWWSQEGKNADVVTPRLNTSPTYYYGTQMLYDGSYVRLKNVEVAYTWSNKTWIRNLGLSSLKLFVSGNNLWMYTNMPDDRETNGSFYSGGGGAYPTVKRINFGLKFSL